MSPQPCVQRLSAAVEMGAIVALQQWTRRRYFRHVGGRRASSLMPASSRAGFAAQASNRSQSFAGMTTTLRSSTSISAASSALRRTKSLTLVCACADAASRSARSSSLNLTLSTDVDIAFVILLYDNDIQGLKCQVETDFERDAYSLEPFRHKRLHGLDRACA